MTKQLNRVVLALAILLLLISLQTATAQTRTRLVRVAELEIDSVHLQAYKAILVEQAAASVKLEPGVVAIFPMYHTESPTTVRILEIYADSAAYRHHLKTPHFLHYKTSTLRMVKSLKLVEMAPMDAATMPALFRKINGRKP